MYNNNKMSTSAALQKMLDDCSKVAETMQQGLQTNNKILEDYNKTMKKYDDEIWGIQQAMNAVPGRFEDGWNASGNTVEWEGREWNCSQANWGGCCREAGGPARKCKACGKSASCNLNGPYCNENLGSCGNTRLSSNKRQHEINSEQARLQNDINNKQRQKSQEAKPAEKYVKVPDMQCCPSLTNIVGSEVKDSTISQVNNCIKETKNKLDDKKKEEEAAKKAEEDKKKAEEKKKADDAAAAAAAAAAARNAPAPAPAAGAASGSQAAAGAVTAAGTPVAGAVTNADEENKKRMMIIGIIVAVIFCCVSMLMAVIMMK